MIVAFTGASSKIGRLVLERLLQSKGVARVHCGVRRPVTLPGDPRVSTFPCPLDEPGGIVFPREADLLVHFAGITHSSDARDYHTVNHKGTLALAEKARAAGCPRMVFLSSRCATSECGPYGDSKRCAEAGLRELCFDSLTVIRPAEVYAAGGAEGVDGMLRLAQRFHIVPALFGAPNISFSPMHAEEFAAACTAVLLEGRNGESIVEMWGPEALGGVEVALRIARRHLAVPVPVLVPILPALIRISAALGVRLAADDQVVRLTGRKTSTGPSDRVPGLSTLRRFCA